MKLRRNFTAREIASMSDDELLKLPEGGLFITFDDGSEVKCKTFKTVYVAPFWEFIVKHGGKITQNHSMCKMVDGEYQESVFTTSTHLNMSEKAFWDTFYSGEEDPKRFWTMSEDIYLATNRIYNYCAMNDGKYLSTMSLNDVMEVMRHPDIKALKDKWLKNEITLEECHDRCYKIVENDTEYFGSNDIHRSVRCGLLSKTQVKQMIGPRGNVPDINSEAMPHIIEAGYYERLNYAYDSIVDSKSASIALYMQGGPLEDSEYNNRCCQLACSYIRKVEYRDCGSRQASMTLIEDKKMLRALSGKNVLTEDGQYTLKGNEASLIGKVVPVRGIASCKEKEQGVVCSACLGQSSYLVPPHASPGHVLIIDPLGQISQTILSTKHVLSNVVALTLDLDSVARKYMHLHEDNKFVVMLNEGVNYEDMYIRIHHSEAQYLSDLDRVDDAGAINITAISDIYQMVFMERKDFQNKNINVVSTEVSGVGSCFTPEALRYIKETGWNIVGDMIEISLANWDHSEPLLVTKRVSQDVKETLNQFKNFINPPKDQRKRMGKTILECETVEEAVDELYAVLKSRLTVSYVQLEMFIKALTAKPDNWLFPTGDDEFRFITLNDSLMNRSAVITLGYQFQCRYVSSPETFLKDEKTVPPHEMDGLVAQGLGFNLDALV